MRVRFSTDQGRLEAFSDGVIAVIITIMVLELKAPLGTDFGALRELIPTVSAYVLSFVFVGIYWNNHHHMLRAVDGIDGRVMWANLHLLFWLSLVPFVTNWLGQHPTEKNPTFLYALVLLFLALSYTLLQLSLVAVNGRESAFAKALSHDAKGYGSLVLYLLAVVFAFIAPVVSDVMFVAVAIIWLRPDRRMEAVIAGRAYAGNVQSESAGGSIDPRTSR
jgi:uncharacterized membrane protein